MPPAKRSQNEEDSFMADLLTNGFFEEQPSPDPVKIRPLDSAVSPCSRLRTPSKRSGRQHGPPSAHTESPLGRNVFKTSPSADVEALTADLNWEDFSDYVPTPKKRKHQESNVLDSSACWSPEPCTRCKALSVSWRRVDKILEKLIVAEVELTSGKCAIVLRDSWVNTDVQPGDIINIIGSLQPNLEASSSSSSTTLTITISTQNNLLIIHPDILVTPTSLASAPTCMRKPLLSSLLRSSPSSPHTPALLYGNVLHEVVQTCLAQNRWDEEFIEYQTEAYLNKSFDELLRIGVKFEEAKQAIRERATGISSFGKRYMSELPKADATVTNFRAERGQTDLLAISKLNDVEEDIWAPKYGLKGKLDASVQITVTTTKSAPNPSTSSIAGPSPLELKTGRVSPLEHRAQTMLYTLLLSDRYNQPVPFGLLFYTQSDTVALVHRTRNEISNLLMMRNELAGWLNKRSRKSAKRHLPNEQPHFLPATIDDEWTCSKCYAVDACMLYRKAVENVDDTTSPIAALYEAKTSHLTTAQAAFFKTWECLITFEENEASRFRKELWTMSAHERALQGRCFPDMRLDQSFSDSSMSNTLGENKIHQFTYRFLCNVKKECAYNLLSGYITVGDAVVISAEPGLFALARGYVLQLSPTDVVIGVDHSLDEERVTQLLRCRAQNALTRHGVVYRIDRDELTGGIGRIRDNLATLFYTSGDSKRLNLVVDLAPPRFQGVSSQLPNSMHLAGLNPSQLSAIEMVLRAEDYALIMGMPGTGKTTVVAALIKLLVSLGKTVLLSAYTHSAVDTILAKLHDADFSILRVGNIDKVHPEAKKYTLSSRMKAHTIEELERQIMTPPVVATTALSLDHPLFSRREFDYCIVDEASQITLPTCLGPLRFADRFVLVGDHLQLPPLVRSNRAREGGFDVSLFQRLSKAHPDSVARLSHQFRMNENIMAVANKLIYEGQLRCGNENVASQALKLPDKTYLNSLHVSCGGRELCWLNHVCEEKTGVVFLDTDTVPAVETRVGDLVQNDVEAELLRQTVEVLVRSGVQESQIGVITVYRQQIKILSRELQHHPGVEILTADKSQGRDKECILVSMVRSNAENQVGNLVKDWRRMNVAFTRAKSKLVIVGSRTTLQHADVFKSFIDFAEERRWICALPAMATRLHHVPTSSFKHNSTKIADNSSGENARSVPSTPEKVAKRRRGDAPVYRNTILKDLQNEYA